MDVAQFSIFIFSTDSKLLANAKISILNPKNIKKSRTFKCFIIKKFDILNSVCSVVYSR
jgi:hypothetical protein